MSNLARYFDDNCLFHAIGNDDANIFFSFPSGLRVHATPLELCFCVILVNRRAFSLRLALIKCGFSNLRLMASSLRKSKISRSRSLIFAFNSRAASSFFFFVMIILSPLDRQILFGKGASQQRVEELPGLLPGLRLLLQTGYGLVLRKPPKILGRLFLYPFGFQLASWKLAYQERS